MKGSRKSNLPLLIKLAQEGYAAVSVQYRLGSRFPARGHDVKCAVRWLRANAAVFNLDGERFAALGYSSGGTMAWLLGLTTPPSNASSVLAPTRHSRCERGVAVAGKQQIRLE